LISDNLVNAISIESAGSKDAGIDGYQEINRKQIAKEEVRPLFLLYFELICRG
jgi:hypothetical protein